MKMKLNDVLVKYAQMEYMSKKHLPIRLSYAIGKNMDALSKEYQRYETERIKTCEMFADKDKDEKPVIKDGAFQMTDENRQELDKVLTELKNTTDVDLQIYKYQKTIDELLDELEGSTRYDALTADDLRILSFIIDE